MFDLLSGKAGLRLSSRHGASRAHRAIQAQVTIELTVGCCRAPRSVPRSPRSLPRRRRAGTNCATGPVEMYERCARSATRANSPVLHAQRRPTERGRGKDALRPHPRRAGGAPVKVRHRVRSPGRGRMLWNDSEHLTRVIERCALGAANDLRYWILRGLDLLARELPADRSCYCGERTNANGSKKFRDAMLEGDWTPALRLDASRSRGRSRS